MRFLAAPLPDAESPVGSNAGAVDLLKRESRPRGIKARED